MCASEPWIPCNCADLAVRTNATLPLFDGTMEPTNEPPVRVIGVPRPRALDDYEESPNE